jgi:DNA mismatch repair protein MutS2
MLKYEEELGMSEKKRKALISEAKQQAEELLAGANRQIENTIREIKEANAEKEQTRQARQRLEKFRDDVQQEEQLREEQLAKEFQQLKRRKSELGRQRPDLQKKSAKKLADKREDIKDTTIRPGDMVKIKDQDTAGEVMEIRGKSAVVIFGNLKSTVKLDKLDKLDKANQTAEKRKAKPVGCEPGRLEREQAEGEL